MNFLLISMAAITTTEAVTRAQKARMHRKVVYKKSDFCWVEPKFTTKKNHLWPSEEVQFLYKLRKYLLRAGTAKYGIL